MSGTHQRAIEKDFSDNFLSFGSPFDARRLDIYTQLTDTNSHHDPIEMASANNDSFLIKNNGEAFFIFDDLGAIKKYETEDEKKQKERMENGGRTKEEQIAYLEAFKAYTDITKDLAEMNIYGGETVQVIDRNGSSVNIYYDKSGNLVGGDDGMSCLTADAINGKFALNVLTDTALGSTLPGQTLIIHKDDVEVFKDDQGNIIGGQTHNSSLTAEATEQATSLYYKADELQNSSSVADATPSASIDAFISTKEDITAQKPASDSPSSNLISEPLEIVIIGGSSSVTPANEPVYNKFASAPSPQP